MSDCIICGRPLPAWFEGDMCGPRCRKKKSRDRLMASQRAHKIAFEIDDIGRTIRISSLSKEEAESLMYTIWDGVSRLIKQVRAMDASGKLSHEEGAEDDDTDD